MIIVIKTLPGKMWEADFFEIFVQNYACRGGNRLFIVKNEKIRKLSGINPNIAVKFINEKFNQGRNKERNGDGLRTKP